MTRSKSLIITSLIITGLGLLGYITGLIIKNSHVTVISTEILGAGIVASIVSLIK